MATDWSKDGRRILVDVTRNINTSQTTKTTLDVDAWSVENRALESLFASPDYSEAAARFSPDGGFIAYESSESGRNEIYIQGPPPSGKVRISSSGGRSPVWRPDGRELFFVSRGSQIMAVDIRSTPRLEAGTPHLLFRALLRRSRPSRRGVSSPYETAERATMTYIQNWAQEARPKP